MLGSIRRRLLPPRSGITLRLLASLRAQFSTHAASRAVPNDGLTLHDFIGGGQLPDRQRQFRTSDAHDAQRSVFIETYGCQMNVNDTEVVLSVLQNAGFTMAASAELADVVLLNTCAIRDNAESKIWQRLGYFKNMKASSYNRTQRRRHVNPSGNLKLVRNSHVPIVGVLGCMAERLKHRLLDSDKMVDLVAGPDAYRDLPRLIDVVAGNRMASDVSDEASSLSRQSAINVQLSVEESYADVVPVRPAGTMSVFLSIMRGCDNMCAFCVVPFTRGRERSRPIGSILDEVCCFISFFANVALLCFARGYNGYLLVNASFCPFTRGMRLIR